MIIKDFIKAIKKDPTEVIILKERLKLDFSVKRLLEFLVEKIPNDNKYIKFNLFQNVCENQAEPEISKAIRMLLRKYLR